MAERFIILQFDSHHKTSIRTIHKSSLICSKRRCQVVFLSWSKMFERWGNRLLIYNLLMQNKVENINGTLSRKSKLYDKRQFQSLQELATLFTLLIHLHSSYLWQEKAMSSNQSSYMFLGNKIIKPIFLKGPGF